MGFSLDRVVPWGRSHSEYLQMFALTPSDLQLNLLDCAGGPASFNAEMTQQAHRVISCDPIYQFSAPEIQQRIQATYPQIIQALEANRDDYLWRGQICSPAQLGEVRMAAMSQFLADFPQGKTQSRYIAAELPNLPFGDRAFDFALCSHLLFSYSAQLSAAFHLEAVRELCRIAQQVRIFPLVTLSGEPSPHLPPILSHLEQQGYQCQILPVDYEFQRGGNQLLQIIAPRR
ncbi:SAM-dependent methyltransferase [Oscillatoria amoena NRMC-F 0135]|nr:SAM-dependent methyltransferase [Oscillatoria amoena NRMC-F 0135]